MRELSDTGPVLVISPHLDDAVLSCGQLIKSRHGTTIITILAGFPPGEHAGWSGRTTGLSVAKDANSQRRDEDERASRALGARTVWVDLAAQEYGSVASPSEKLLGIQEAIATAVATTEVRSVFAPLGITNPDHILVSDAALLALRAANVESYLYMDMPYGQAGRGEVRRRVRHIGRTFDIDPLIPFRGDLQTKADAVNAYSSQLAELRKGFGRHFKRVFTDPEKYWRVRPPK
ncbi:MAG TPA: PIG-L family deacetylase [Chloroflexota bacterium]|nr:PIG-L family deacetylase [Chloroflexota bacterium]